MKKLFIITIGPSGSGKEYIEKSLLEHISNQLQDKIDVNINDIMHAKIDDLVETDEDYIKESLSVTQKHWINDEESKKYILMLNNVNYCQDQVQLFNERQHDICANLVNTENLENSFFKKIENVAQQYHNIYFNVRRKYNDILDCKINLWLSERKNIIFDILIYQLEIIILIFNKF